jgi:mono/diheme cytochrome c family protein
LFTGACASCHTGGQTTAPPRGIDLALSTAISQSDPRNAILIVLEGVGLPGENAGPAMPGFAGAFTDAQLAALLNYVRVHHGGGPAWTDLESRIDKARKDRKRP